MGKKIVTWRDRPKVLIGNGAALLDIAELAVIHSEGRLRIAISENNEDDTFKPGAARFLKLDGKRLGRDIEQYDFMGRKATGWEMVLLSFLGEVVTPLKVVLPESYKHASAALKKLGLKIYRPEAHADWRACF